MRDTTIFYRSFFEAIKELPTTNQAEVYEAIFEYSLNFNLIELQGLSKTIFTLIKPQIEANIKRFESGTKAKHKRKVSETEAKPKQDISETEANNNNNNNNNVNNNKNENDEITLTEFHVTDLIIENILNQNQLMSHYANLAKPKLRKEEIDLAARQFLNDKKEIGKTYKNLVDLKSHISNYFKTYKTQAEPVKTEVEKYKLFKG